MSVCAWRIVEYQSTIRRPLILTMQQAPIPIPDIAVVEDDEDIRINVCRFLEKSGMRPWGASPLKTSMCAY